MKLHFETRRFLVRDLELIDAPGMFEMDSDPLVHKYLGNMPVQSIEEVKIYIERVQSQYRDRGLGRWAIIEKETKEFIGWCGLKFEEELRSEFSYIDLGYRLIRRHWGRGVATETAIGSLHYGFGHLELTEICACADVDHLVSNHILQKVGLQYLEQFEYHGSLCNWYRMNKDDYKRVYLK